MKSFLILLIVATNLHFSITVRANSTSDPKCKKLTVKLSGSKKMQQLFNWRKKNTYPVKPGEFVATTDTRENEIKTTVSDMETSIRGDATPSIEFNPGNGINLTDLGDGPSDTYGQAHSYRVTGLKNTNGILHGSVMLPVSGHADSAMVDKWAKRDTLNLYYVDEKGAKHDLLTKKKSLGLVTISDVAIPLKKGKKVSLEYFRDGSAGVGGFISGRVIQFIWDGN